MKRFLILAAFLALTFLACTNSDDALFDALRAYLEAQFSPAEVRSIFYHELVHWLRLLPYKLRKDPGLAPMFFAGFLMVANDVYRWFEEDEAGHGRS